MLGKDRAAMAVGGCSRFAAETRDDHYLLLVTHLDFC